jgi:hypothetical protein
MCVVGDKHGDLWLGTYNNGICRMDAMANITTLDGLPNNTVWCGIVDPDSTLWFGTSDGLCHIARGKVLPLDSGRALIGQRVLCLFRRDDGALWCGTRDGVSVIRATGPAELITNVDGIALRGVRSILGGPKGTLWLATDLGIVRIGNGKAQRFTTLDGLAHNTVFCLTYDAEGRLWAGTSNGLSCFTGERFVSMELGSDFGSNYVGLLQHDTGGELWAGTNNGLYRFLPDSLLQDPENADHFTQVDGLRGSECNLNAGFTGADGRLFFGTNAGLTMYDPHAPDLRRPDVPPRTYITGISSFLQPIPGADSLGVGNGPNAPIDVPYRKNHLTFTYTAIALADGSHVRFQYRLAGFDSDWLPATEARSASYSNLPDGNFAFEVRAIDPRGHWGKPAQLAFSIAPPYWLTWWFFAVVWQRPSWPISCMAFRRYPRACAGNAPSDTRQLELRSRMLKLEQQALNANMNRHFIFNALNSIQYAINRQDRTAAEQVPHQLREVDTQKLRCQRQRHHHFGRRVIARLGTLPFVGAHALQGQVFIHRGRSNFRGCQRREHPRDDVAALRGKQHLARYSAHGASGPWWKWQVEPFARVPRMYASGSHDDGIGIDQSMDGKEW